MDVSCSNVNPLSQEDELSGSSLQPAYQATFLASLSMFNTFIRLKNVMKIRIYRSSEFRMLVDVMNSTTTLSSLSIR